MKSLQCHEADPSRDLTDKEFSRLAAALTEHTGILFNKRKRRDFQIKLATYLEELTPPARLGLIDRIEDSGDELQHMINLLTIGESYFFRNRPHFTALEERILPDLIERNKTHRRLRIWCAGCSTGEEPYSLAILIKERFPQLADWKVDILATDINTSFLDRAKLGVYTRWSFRSVEPQIISRYFAREGENRYRLKTEMIGDVHFDTLNLSKPSFRDRLDMAPFDLIMCRNVLIYFSYEAANRLIEAMKDVIVPDGFLIVGHAESFPALRDLEAIYAHATYFYRRLSGPRPKRHSIHPVHTLSVPGIGVQNVERKSGVFARRDPTIPPLPTVDPATVTTDDNNLEHALEVTWEHTDRGDLSQASALLDELRDGPGNLDHRVHFLRALVADQENRITDALANLKQVIFLNKAFAIGHYYYAVICEREGDLKTAARYLRNVMSITDNMPDDIELDEGGGMTAKMLREIVTERIKEVSWEPSGDRKQA